MRHCFDASSVEQSVRFKVSVASMDRQSEKACAGSFRRSLPITPDAGLSLRIRSCYKQRGNVRVQSAFFFF